MEMRVLENKVVILPHKPKDVSEGGIYLPEQAQEEVLAGQVVAIGPGLWESSLNGHRPMTVKVGDIVVYPRHAGADMKVGSERFRIVRENELHLILD